MNSYEGLSPMFRAAHNKLRVARGLKPLPEPKVSLWTPQPPRMQQQDANDLKEATGAAREFAGPRMMIPGKEGFEIR